MRRREFLALLGAALATPRSFAGWDKPGNATGSSGTWSKIGCAAGPPGTWQKVACLGGSGYFGGGYIFGALSSEIDGIDFATETTINPAAALVTARSALAGVNSSAKGYFGGGYINGGWSDYNTSEIDGIDFATETTINPAAALVRSRSAPAGVNSSAKGYFGGGYFGGGWGGVLVSEIDGIDFATETTIDPAAALVVARNGSAGVNSSAKGYFGGGWAGYYTSEIDGINFATEAAINPAAALVAVRSVPAGVNSSAKGYFGGGWAGYNSSEIDGIDFATESAINPAAGLVTARGALVGVNSSAKGYFGGGEIIVGWSVTFSSEIDGIDFATESAINPAAGLVVARYSLAGVQSGSL